MTRESVVYTLTVDVRLFDQWVNFLRVLVLCCLLSDDQAADLACRGNWLILWRIDGGRWHFLRRTTPA